MTTYIYIVKVSTSAYRLELNKPEKNEPKDQLYKELTKSLHEKTCAAAFKCTYGVSAHADLMKLFAVKYAKHASKDAFSGNVLEMALDVLSYMQKRNEKNKDGASEVSESPDAQEAADSPVSADSPKKTEPIDLLTN
jgi:hypothetical protein